MRSARDTLLTNVALHCRAAWPRHTVKSLQRAVGLNAAQAARVIATGHVPIRVRDVFLEAVRNAIVRNQQELRRLHTELKAIEHAAPLDTTTDLAPQKVGPDTGDDS